MKPLLCADIGNSHTTIGLLEDGDVVDHWRVASDERRTADEWGVLLKGLLSYSPLALTTSNVVAVPKSTTMEGPS